MNGYFDSPFGHTERFADFAVCRRGSNSGEVRSKTDELLGFPGRLPLFLQRRSNPVDQGERPLTIEFRFRRSSIGWVVQVSLLGAGKIERQRLPAPAAFGGLAIIALVGEEMFQ